MDMVLSKKGIHFTARSVDAFPIMEKVFREDNYFVILVGAFDGKGVLDLGFGGDDIVQSGAIEDMLGDVTFYWYVDQPLFETVRSKYYVDVEWGRKTRVALLEETEKHDT